MQAIIVAGGRGERLRPITDSIPKPMVEVDGKPILEHTINLLRNHGITDVILALCYLPEVVEKYFGDGRKFGVKIAYTYENPDTPLGTAGAVRSSKKNIDGDFIVTYADILRRIDVTNMIDRHKSRDSLATINVYKRFGKDPKSMIVFDKKQVITSFVERPVLTDIDNNFVWANGSFYIFDQEIFEFIDDNEQVDFGKDIFPKIVKTNRVYAHPTTDYFIDIGTLDKLEQARQTFIP